MQLACGRSRRLTWRAPTRCSTESSAAPKDPAMAHVAKLEPKRGDGEAELLEMIG